MARRASSGINPGLLIGVAVFVIVAFVGGKMFLGRKPDAIAGSKIEMRDMLENANQLRGNEYVIEGVVDEKLRWTPDRGQVVSLKVEVPGGSAEYVGVEIPADFSSLNLAQAVMIVCYELFRGALEAPREFTPRLANRFELDAMYAQLKDVLLRICFINPSNPDYFMNNLRHFGTRMQLRAKEVQIIRGICRQIDWYGKRCFEEGQRAKNGGG